MNEEQNSNKIICGRSNSNCDEDTHLSTESISKTALTRKRKSRRRSDNERADYKQQVIDELNGDDLYARAKMVEDIFEEVMPIESCRSKRSSQDMQLYGLDGNSNRSPSGSENENSKTHSFRKFVGREKNKRLEALKRIAADAKKLKRNTEIDQRRMDEDRWNRMCGDFTQFASAALPVHPTFGQPSCSDGFEHIDDEFGSRIIHSTQRKYPHDSNRRRFVVDRLSIGDPFTDVSAPEYTDTEFEAYTNAYDSDEYDLPSIPKRKSSRTARRDFSPDDFSYGDQVADFDTFIVFREYNLPSDDRDALYYVPPDDEFGTDESLTSLQRTPYVLKNGVPRTQAFEDDFAEGANAYDSSNIELFGTHHMRNPTNKSFRKPKVALNKEISMWQRLLDDELLSYEESRSANANWDEINHEYDASRHIVENIFDSIINDVQECERQRNPTSDGNHNSAADAVESDSLENLDLPPKRFKKYSENGSSR